MEKRFLLALEQRLTRMEPIARAELIQSSLGRENILKIWTTSRRSSSLTKYSPDHYHLVRVNNTPSSLSILTVTHMEEEVEQVDFMVDLSQPPDPVLVQFLSSNLSRQMQFCYGLEEERLLLSNIDCSQVLIERFGGNIRVRSRSCLRTVDTTDINLTANGGAKTILTNGNEDNCIASFVCQECQLLLGGPAGGDGVKRELIESCPDLPPAHLDDDEEEGCQGEDLQDPVGEGLPSLEDFVCGKEDVAKEEIKKILSKVDERKERGRRPVKKKKKKNEEKYDDNDEGNDDWNGDAEDETDWGEAGVAGGKNRKSSNLFCCPHIECGATFAKEVAQMSHILKYHPTDHTKVTEGWVRCTEPDCFHVEQN